MKKSLWIAGALGAALLMTACSGNTQSEQQNETFGEETSSESQKVTSVSETDAQETAESGSHILIAYFSRLENTDADLDTIVQGGGPYGEIGNSYEEAELDALSSASITVLEGEAKGNTQAAAEMIQEVTGGDLFSIHTEEGYPVDYDTLIDLGGEERNGSARPALSEQVGNMEDYDIIFLGFPNWWQDMPMALYSFLDGYDFSGKMIIPFATSAGSGLSGAAASVQEVQPDAQVSEQGLHIPMREVAGARSQIELWIQELGIL